MNRKIALLGGVGLGAGVVMYFLDPAAGRRRRALVRDKISSWWRKGHRALDATARDIGNRAQGTLASVGVAGQEGVGDDSVLEARVRSRIGHVVSYPSAISVNAQGGSVILTGDILRDEVDDLMTEVARTPGVTSAENRISVHDSADNAPALKGHRRHRRRVPGGMPRAWRVLGLTAGGIGTYYGVRYALERHKPVSRWDRVMRRMPSYDFGRLRRWSPENRALAGTAAGALAYYGARMALRYRTPAPRWRRMVPSLPDLSTLSGMIPDIPASARKSFSRLTHGIGRWVH